MFSKIKFLLKKFLKGFKKNKIEKLIDKLIFNQVCIDIGASYFPHPNWNFFINKKETNWVAIDPNAYNLNYCDNWKFLSKVNKEPVALSSSGGKKILYKTATDSGSSLLEFISSNNNNNRINESYFFPIKKIKIDTVTVNKILKKYVINDLTPVMLKLDIQSYELELLKSIEKKFIKNNILCVETEYTLLTDPYNLGVKTFDHLISFMFTNNFELVRLDPFQINLPKINSKIKTDYSSNEADFVFLLKHSEIIKRDINQCFTMLGIYFSYNLFSEIYSLSLEILKNKKLDLNQKRIIGEIIKILKP